MVLNLTVAADEGDSDEDPEPIIQEDSGTETDGTQSVLGSDDVDEAANNGPGLTISSSPDTPNPSSYRPSIDNIGVSSGTPTKSRTAHSATVAANRGLHIRTERARSHVPPISTLPSSPRTNAHQSSTRLIQRGTNSQLANPISHQSSHGLI